MRDDEAAPNTPEDPPGARTALPSPARDGQWVEPDGTIWRLRGDRHQPTAAKRVERLMHSPQVRVLHFYGVQPTEVGPDDREALWQRMRPYLRNTELRKDGDFTDFTADEFRDDQRRSMLIIKESC